MYTLQSVEPPRNLKTTNIERYEALFSDTHTHNYITSHLQLLHAAVAMAPSRVIIPSKGASVYRSESSKPSPFSLVVPDLQLLEQQGRGATTAIADAGEAQLSGLELHCHAAHDPRSRHSNGMPQADSTTVDIDFGLV